MTQNDYVALVNKTSRSRGAVGGNSLVLRTVLSLPFLNATILDYGAGKDAIQTKRLREEGYRNVTAYEIGENFNPELHDPKATEFVYDIVMASNVLNVQPDVERLRDVIEDLANCTRFVGLCVVNYPSGPRKAGLSLEEVLELLREKFAYVNHEGKGVIFCHPSRF